MNTFKGKFYNAMTDDDRRMIVSFAIDSADTYAARQCVEKIRQYKRDGKELLSIGVDIARQKRSPDANAYFHVLVSEIAKVLKSGMEEVKQQMVFDYGTVMSDETGKKVGFKLPASVDVHNIYKYAKWFDEREENGIKFNCYIIYKRTSELDAAEMARLIDGVVSECRAIGIPTEPPDKIANMISLWGTQNITSLVVLI